MDQRLQLRCRFSMMTIGNWKLCKVPIAIDCLFNVEFERTGSLRLQSRIVPGLRKHNKCIIALLTSKTFSIQNFKGDICSFACITTDDTKPLPNKDNKKVLKSTTIGQHCCWYIQAKRVDKSSKTSRGARRLCGWTCKYHLMLKFIILL